MFVSHCTFQYFQFQEHASPWYDHNGWLGVKHQVTYLLLNMSVQVGKPVLDLEVRRKHSFRLETSCQAFLALNWTRQWLHHCSLLSETHLIRKEGKALPRISQDDSDISCGHWCNVPGGCQSSAAVSIFCPSSHSQPFPLALLHPAGLPKTPILCVFMH